MTTSTAAEDVSGDVRFRAGSVAVLVGVSGSGKSTFAARYPASWRLNLDAFREMAADDAADQSATPTAAQVQDLLLDARLRRGLTTVVDATNVLPHVRAGILAAARYYQRPAEGVLFTVPLTECLRRNAARERQVPAHVLHTQHTQLPSREQLLTEGFTHVHTIEEGTTV